MPQMNYPADKLSRYRINRKVLPAASSSEQAPRYSRARINRLLIVSNRLPITLYKKNGQIRLKPSNGGLSSGLKSFLESSKKGKKKKMDYLWVGWPGMEIEQKKVLSIKEKLLKKSKLYPVNLNQTQIENFYSGFCNQVLWPLFHYLPQYLQIDKNYLKDYEDVNNIFCEEILKVVRQGDLIFVNDYHLMLLPKMLRDKGLTNPINFFLHTPFPCYDIFKMLSQEARVKILEGVLGADVVGFQTDENVRHFIESVQADLKYEEKMGLLSLPEREVIVKSFPIGIDFNKFKGPRISTLEKNSKTHQILSVDRLDYTKGIIDRLLGVEEFLENNPEYRKKVNFNFVVVPSRISIESYRILKKQIEKLINKINFKFIKLGIKPIKFLYKQLSFDKLVSLYKKSEVALVTPLRDGMNLVAKEFVASKSNKKGVLILSEFAGAAKELNEAILVNPNDKMAISSAIKQALEMSVPEQIMRNKSMQQKIKEQNITKWVSEIIKETLGFVSKRKKETSMFLDNKLLEGFLEKYLRSKKRLIFLDYDGTLVPFANTPSPALSRPSKELTDLIEKLSVDPKNQVVIVSGRSKNTLEGYFKDLDELGLSAEHGVWVKKNRDWKMLKQIPNEWKKDILKYLRIYSKRLSGSIIESKDYSLAFHYRQSNEEDAEELIKEMIINLLPQTEKQNLQILLGHKVIEIKDRRVNKGGAVKEWLMEEKYDFVLGIGDDLTDEDLFKALPKKAFSVKVGTSPSRAEYWLSSVLEVMGLLDLLMELRINRDKVNDYFLERDSNYFFS